MRFEMLTLLIALVAFSPEYVGSFEMNMTKYFQMPSLNNFDDYDRCMQEFQNPSTYCFVRAEVIPKAQSDAWNAIQEISKYNKHHYDHRHLYFGLCLHRCIKDLMKENNTDVLYVGSLKNNTKVNTLLNLFASEVANRERYNRLSNQCVNLFLTKNFGLEAESVVEYCNTNKDVVVQDSWNLTFYVILCVILLCVTFSTLYDLYVKQSQKEKIFTDKDHYRTTLLSKCQQALVLFSIPRNWYRLSQEPSGKAGRDLRFLDCLKFFSMFLVIFAHTTWVMYEGAISNPFDPERMLHTTAGTLLMSGSLITVTFFVVSGFLLTLTWEEISQKKKIQSWIDYVRQFAVFNIFRYIRLTVPYAFVILLSGLYFESPGGPLWRHIVEREQLACRKNWYANLLYINNYVNYDERCMLQSWYLAADTHSFVLSLLILMVAHKWPALRNAIFGLVFAIFFFLPGIVAYVKEYSPILIPSPQVQRDSFIDNRDFTEFYVPFQMNFGSYFSGVITALVYNWLSTNDIKLKQYISVQCAWYALFPLGVLWIFSSHPFVQNYFTEPPLFWSSVYAAMQKTLWAVGLGCFIIGMAMKIGWVFREFSSLPVFRILGRLTYGAFITHLFVARITLAALRQPIYFNTYILFAFVLFTLVVSYLFSFILAILVELPISAFLKLVR